MEDENKAETGATNCSHNCGGDDGRQRLIDLGSAVTHSSRGNIYTLTIVVIRSCRRTPNRPSMNTSCPCWPAWSRTRRLTAFSCC